MQVVVDTITGVEIISDTGIGPQGPPGDAASAVITVSAGEAIGGHRLASLQGGVAMYARGDNLESAESAIGITLGAASLSGSLQVQRSGIITEPSWSWAAGPVYLAGAGLLTQAAPGTGVLLQVGIALSPIQLDVRIGTPIELL